MSWEDALKHNLMINLTKPEKTGSGLSINFDNDGITETETEATVTLYPETITPACNHARGLITLSLMQNPEDLYLCGADQQCPGHCIQWNTPPVCDINIDENGNISGELWESIWDEPDADGYLGDFTITSSRPDDVVANNVTTEVDEETGRTILGGSVTIQPACSIGSTICINFKSYETFCFDHGFSDIEPKGVARSCCQFVFCSGSACEDPPPEMSWMTKPSSTTHNSTDVELEVSGGTSPYDWSISIDGGNATLDFSNTVGKINYMDMDGSACGTVTVTVTDACDVELIGKIRVSDSGIWCLNTACPIGGCHPTHDYDDPSWRNKCSSASMKGRYCKGYAGRSEAEQTWWSCYCDSWNTGCYVCHPDCDNQEYDCSWYGEGVSPIEGSYCPNYTKSCLYDWTCDCD